MLSLIPLLMYSLVSFRLVRFLFVWGVGRIEYCYSGVAVSITSSIILGRE